MLSNITIGKYIYKDSLIHKLSPQIKIIFLFLLVGISLLSSCYENIFIFLLTIVIASLSKITIKTYLKNIYSIRILILSIIIIDLIFKTNIIIIINSILKLIISIIIASNFLYTTTINEINFGLNKILKPLNMVKIDTNKISFIITLSIKFIYIVTNEINILLKSFKSKGLKFDGNLIERINKIKKFLSTLFYLVLKRSDNIADILEIRNYDLKKINMLKIKINFFDYLFIIINILLLIIIKGVI